MNGVAAYRGLLLLKRCRPRVVFIRRGCGCVGGRLAAGHHTAAIISVDSGVADDAPCRDTAAAAAGDGNGDGERNRNRSRTAGQV